MNWRVGALAGLVARRKPRLDELAAALTDEFGVRAVGLGCDLSKAASLKRLPAESSRSGWRCRC